MRVNGMLTHNHVFDLIPGYALEALDEAETNQVRLHLAQCAICQEELYMYQDLAGLLSSALPQAAPSQALRGRLLDGVTPTSAEGISPRLMAAPPRVRETPLRVNMPLTIWQRLFPPAGQFRSAALALVGLILVLGVSNLLLWRQVRDLSGQIVETHMIVEPLFPKAGLPETTGIIVMDPHGTFGTVIVDAFPPSSDGEQYQVWLSRDQTVVSGGVFTVHEDGYGAIVVFAPDPLISYTRVWVTVEAEGGSEHPSEMVMLQSDP